MKSNSLNATRARELLEYDAATGVFTWKQTCRTSWAGKVAGTKHCKGYQQICLDGVVYLAHRLAWLYVHGEFPAGPLDHKDRNRTNNRIDNLRPVNGSQNQQNRVAQRNSTSGLKGVCWDKSRQKWSAHIRVDDKQKTIGRYDTREAAYAAYVRVASQVHTHNPVANGGPL